MSHQRILLIINKVPYTYQHLREHIATSHSDVLEAFEKGWQVLGPEVQNRWIARGLGGDVRAWQSWVDVCLEESIGVAKPRAEAIHDHLTGLIKERLTHAGEVFGLPPMAYVARPAYITPEGETISMNESFLADDGRWQIHRVARAAAKNILHDELLKLSERLEKDIKENGLNAIRQWYPRKAPPANDSLFSSYIDDYGDSSDSSDY
jgi:hypothetical protein